MTNNKPCKQPKWVKRKQGKFYGRLEAYKLLGFPMVKDLTDWLIDNHFMDDDHKPAEYLIKKGYMRYTSKKLYLGPRHFLLPGVAKIYLRNTGCPTKNVNVPFFSNKGIDFCKRLMRDTDQLQQVVNDIKASCRPGFKKNNYLQVKKYINEHNI